MQGLEKILNRERMSVLEREGQDRMLAEGIFTEWRDRYVANLCGYIRLCRQAKEDKLAVPDPYRSPQWCNAAVHILTHADLEIQDYFLRALPVRKDVIVAAVLSDGGITRLDGMFVELPES